MPPLPPATKYLILACTAIFCLQLFLPLENTFALYSLGSGLFMPWQLVTYAFLHASVPHLFFNMLMLWMFGAELEQVWGPRRYLQYLLAGVLAAAVAQLLVAMLMGSASETLGASGGIYALLLAYALVLPGRRFDLVGFLPMLLLFLPSTALNVLGLLLYFALLTNRQSVPIPPVVVPARVMVIALGSIELVMGLFGRDGIAHFAHLGGMAGGYLMILYWRNWRPAGRRRR